MMMELNVMNNMENHSPPIAPQNAPERLRVFGVFSGKGGVGKSCLAVNLACVMAQRGRKVLVIDADLGLANAEILLGIRPRYHIGDIIRGRSLSDVVSDGPHGLGVLSGGSGVAELAAISDEQKSMLIGALDSIEDQYDTLVIDAGAGVGENVRFFIGAAHERILVLDPEPTAMTDAYAAAKVMGEHGIRNLSVIVNRVNSELEARTVFRLLADVAHKHLPIRLGFVGAIPRDPAVARAVSRCQPVIDVFPRSAAAMAYHQVSERLLAHEPDEVGLDGGLKFMWNRLLRETSK